MTEAQKTEDTGPGPFNQRRYEQGYRHATEDIVSDGVPYVEWVIENQLPKETWYKIGFRTALNVYKEGQAI